VQASEWQRTLRDRAERMRRNPTRAEATLWSELRRRPGGLLFWTQHVIGSRYIADFYCPAARLVIEVDGDSHHDRAAQDRQRDNVMHEYGFRVMRLTNIAVLADPAAAAARIVDAAANPKVLDAQRKQEEARRKALEVLTKQQAQVRQRPTRQPLKGRFRCTWCLSEFVTALEPRPSCRRCQTFELLPVCFRCGWRRCAKPRDMCRTCADAAFVARGAIGTPVEHVNRNSRHRVRKIM
jgi:very-short-patch-repair endonuclease